MIYLSKAKFLLQLEEELTQIDSEVINVPMQIEDELGTKMYITQRESMFVFENKTDMVGSLVRAVDLALVDLDGDIMEVE